MEGAELGALQSVDWDAARIDVISLEREGDDDAAVNFLTNRGYHIEPYGRWRQEMMLFHPSVELGKPRAQLVGGAGREVGRHGCGPVGLVLDSLGTSHPLGFGCLCLATWCPQLSPTIASHEKKGAWQRAKQQAHVLLTPPTGNIRLDSEAPSLNAQATATHR